jgi:quaternary ammonium compound-resistance protein SugE
MAWIYLILAGVFEIGFTTALRYVDKTWPILPILVFLVFSSASFLCLTLATRTIPLGTSYAVWTGIGAAGTAIVGLIWYNEPADTARLVFLAILVGSIAGLKLVSTH